MQNRERHLETKIRIFEDMILRCKNYSEIESIRAEVTKMRVELQKMYFKRVGS